MHGNLFEISKGARIGILALALVFLLPAVRAAHAADAVGDDTVTQTMDKVGDILQTMEKARQKVEEMRRIGDADGEKEARKRFDAAEGNLEQARVDALAQAAGVSREKVLEMRASGMGWGRMAHELGVSPSVLGVGHANARGDGSGKGRGNNGKTGNGKNKAKSKSKNKGKGKNK